MHLRNMGCAWSSSIVSTCFLSLCACVSEPHGSQPKIEVPRRTLALPPVRRPDAPRDVGRSEARTLLSTAHTLANLSPDLGSSGTNRRREVGWGCWVGRFATHAAKKEGLRVWGPVRTFSGRSRSLSCTIDRCGSWVTLRRKIGAPQWAILTSIVSWSPSWIIREGARRTARKSGRETMTRRRLHLPVG